MTNPVPEGAAARVKVRLAAVETAEVSVSYRFGPVEAPLLEGTLVFTPGTTERELSVLVPDDSTIEVGEQVRLELFDPVNASIAVTETFVDVRDDDDRTPPVVTCPLRPVFRLAERGARVTVTVSDSGSGPVTPRVSGLADTSTVGTKSIKLTGRDRAGNATTVRCEHVVTYVFRGFLHPVDNPGVLNTMDAGLVVPLRWQLVDAAGRPVTKLANARVTVLPIACGSRREDPVEETAAAPSGLVNRKNGSYELAWRSADGFAGSCKALRLDLGDGLPRTAFFRFTS